MVLGGVGADVGLKQGVGKQQTPSCPSRRLPLPCKPSQASNARKQVHSGYPPSTHPCLHALSLDIQKGPVGWRTKPGRQGPAARAGEGRPRWPDAERADDARRHGALLRDGERELPFTLFIVPWDGSMRCSEVRGRGVMKDRAAGRAGCPASPTVQATRQGGRRGRSTAQDQLARWPFCHRGACSSSRAGGRSGSARERRQDTAEEQRPRLPSILPASSCRVTSRRVRVSCRREGPLALRRILMRSSS